MSESRRELVQVRAVSMYPTQWTIVHRFSHDQGYGSTSAALRRIVDEWEQMRLARSLLIEARGASTGAPGSR